MRILTLLTLAILASGPQAFACGGENKATQVTVTGSINFYSEATRVAYLSDDSGSKCMGLTMIENTLSDQELREFMGRNVSVVLAIAPPEEGKLVFSLRGKLVSISEDKTARRKTLEGVITDVQKLDREIKVVLDGEKTISIFHKRGYSDIIDGATQALSARKLQITKGDRVRIRAFMHETTKAYTSDSIFLVKPSDENSAALAATRKNVAELIEKTKTAVEAGKYSEAAQAYFQTMQNVLTLNEISQVKAIFAKVAVADEPLLISYVRTSILEETIDDSGASISGADILKNVEGIDLNTMTKDEFLEFADGFRVGKFDANKWTVRSRRSDGKMESNIGKTFYASTIFDILSRLEEDKSINLDYLKTVYRSVILAGTRAAVNAFAGKDEKFFDHETNYLRRSTVERAAELYGYMAARKGDSAEWINLVNEVVEILKTSKVAEVLKAEKRTTNDDDRLWMAAYEVNSIAEKVTFKYLENVSRRQGEAFKQGLKENKTSLKNVAKYFMQLKDVGGRRGYSTLAEISLELE